jgi:hypothetical protein
MQQITFFIVAESAQKSSKCLAKYVNGTLGIRLSEDGISFIII